MSKKIKCPRCNMENEESVSRCFNCGSFLISNSEEADSIPDWLASLRAANINGDQSELSKPENQFESNNSDELNGQESSDWLERIKNIKNEEENNQLAEDKKPDKIVDFTSSDNNDLVQSLRNPENLEELEPDEWLSEILNTSPNGKDESENEFDNDEIEKERDDDQEPSPIDNIKNNWQVEFPFSENLDNDEGIPPAEEFPEWLKNNVSGLDAGNENSEDLDFPTWLSPEEEPSIDTNKSSIDPISLPEWLSKSNFLVDDQISDHEDDEFQDEMEDLPDWINEIKSGKEKSFDEDESIEPESDLGIKESFKSELLFNKLELLPEKLNKEDQISDSISDKSRESEPEEINSGQTIDKGPAFILEDSELKSYSIKPFIGIDENGDWLDHLDSIPEINDSEQPQADHFEEIEEQAKSKAVLPFSFGDVPDWLENVDFDYNEIGTVESVEQENVSPITSDEMLEKGNLPEWLKSIRPVELVTPDVSKLKSQKKVESSGPLAGLQGVLSSEGISNSYSTPPTYSVSINISEKQRSHIEILEEILSPKKQIVSKTQRKKSLLHRLEKFVIPIFMLLIVTYSLFLDHSTVRYPENLPPDAIRFHNLVTSYLNRNLEPGHVLIIFETNASSYPEMNLITRGFFENIFVNNHWITTIATNPNGVLISENILENAHLNVPSYNFEERYTNLGYLPGIGIGMQSFLSDPTKFSSVDLNLQIWDRPPHNMIKTVNDFDMVVLLTDNSENSKLWIEQINFLASETSFLVISTTQASPLLQPYLETNQVDGMLAGLMGGSAFDTLANTDTSSFARYWSITQLLVVIFVFFILAGGVISIFYKAFSIESKEKHK